MGDDVSSYEHITIEMPGPSGGVEKLNLVKKGADGNCIYLGSDGCTIHDRAPSICREFDCRRFFLSKTRNERRALLKSGMASSDVIRAGRERLGTL
jgi:Fe-S-cluster containining protein